MTELNWTPYPEADDYLRVLIELRNGGRILALHHIRRNNYYVGYIEPYKTSSSWASVGNERVYALEGPLECLAMVEYYKEKFGP